MHHELLNWLKENVGRTFSSPRKDAFRGNSQDFTIRYIDEEDELVRISFGKKETLALPLFFWMFERTLEHLRQNPETVYPIGAKLQPPYPMDSIEDAIWRAPRLYSSPYKSAPHVLDILALAGCIQFRHTRSRETGRLVQGAILSLTGSDLDPTPSNDKREKTNVKSEDREYMRNQGNYGKYRLLYEYLNVQTTPSIRLSFDRLNEILGFPLPASAYKHHAWWSNGGHSHCFSWMNAGYNVIQIEMGNFVVFAKTGKPKDERLDPSRGTRTRTIWIENRIPISCPQCGAFLIDTEVTWVGPDKFRCPTCGAVNFREKKFFKPE